MSSKWKPVATLPPLGIDEVQLWRIRLPDATQNSDIYRQHLSSNELERAERLRTGQVRMQFLVARAALRGLLSNLLNVSANLVPITFGRYGKPETAVGDGLPLFFNVAHSGETILIALCRSSPVGVDVEYFNRQTEVLEIARASFTNSEFLKIDGISDPVERQRLFFRFWTRKEAVIKADGRGLSLPLDLVEIPTNDNAVGTPVVIKGSSAEEADAQSWLVTDINLSEGVAAAFAVRRADLALRTFDFPPPTALRRVRSNAYPPGAVSTFEGMNRFRHHVRVGNVFSLSR